MSVKKNFYSDNVSGAAPEILQALVAANAGDTAPYGADPTTEGLQARFAELFETEVEVFPVGTGTAANGLCASIVAAPYGAIYLSDAAHLHGSECGGPEFWSGGNARTIPVPSVDGKIAVAELARMVDEASPAPPPRCRRGRSASRRARRRARCTPWPRCAPSPRRPAHGACGCTWTAPAWPTPSPASAARRPRPRGRRASTCSPSAPPRTGRSPPRPSCSSTASSAQSMRYRRRRGGHLFSKMRFLSVQLEAFIADDLWLRNARHANAMAQRVREGLATIPGVRFRSPTEINFVLVSPAAARLGRPRRRGLQLLPPRRPQRGHHPDRLRLRHDRGGGGRPGGDRPPSRRHATRGRPSVLRREVTGPSWRL